jgi:hypothetical protein
MTPNAVNDDPAHRRALAALALVAVALASGLTGAAVDRAYMRQSARIVGDTAFHPLSSALRTPSDADRKQIRAELSTALDLTPEQERLIDSIMTSRSGQFEELRASIRPRVESLLTNMRSDVETVLTSDQREKYRKLRNIPSTPVATTPR